MSAPVVSSAPRGSNFVRMGMALAATRGSTPDAAHLAGERWGHFAMPARVLRAATAAGSTIPDASWGAELADFSTAAAEFWSIVAERSVVARLSGLRRVPLNIRTVVASTGATAYWIGERQPVPVSRMGFDASPLPALKIGGMLVITTELALSSNPKAEAVIRADLARVMQVTLDYSFLDPDNGGTDGVAPASVLFGIAPTPATGTTAGDIKALVAAFAGDLESAFFIASASHLAGLTGLEFPNVGARGGELAGIPVLASSAAGDRLILVDPAGIAFGEDDMRLDVGSQGTVEMLDNPVGDATTQVSLWQENLSSVRGIKPVNWRAIRPSISYVDYGA